MISGGGGAHCLVSALILLLLLHCRRTVKPSTNMQLATKTLLKCQLHLLRIQCSYILRLSQFDVFNLRAVSKWVLTTSMTRRAVYSVQHCFKHDFVYVSYAIDYSL